MTDPRELEYRLLVDGEAHELVAGITLGRHLDSDVVVAGEDVLDFHLRIDLSARGPVAIPLGEALVYHNQQALDLPVGLMPGDRLDVGQSVIELGVDPIGPPEADAWCLYAPGDAMGLPVRDELHIGREPGSHLLLTDLYASRRHARLCNIGGSIWLQDLDSANGTFLNGERVRGARRVFHGDEIRLDSYTCQLLGEGGDLTPARRGAEHDLVPLVVKFDAVGETGDDATLEFVPGGRATGALPETPAAMSTGLYLVLVNGPGGVTWHRLAMGRSVLGRDQACALHLQDQTVSGHHAEVVVRPEGASVTDLMSTNGTLCNGRKIQSVRLTDGDRLSLGRLELVYREIRPEPSRARQWTGPIVALLALTLALTVAGAMALGWL